MEKRKAGSASQLRKPRRLGLSYQMPALFRFGSLSLAESEGNPGFGEQQAGIRGSTVYL